MSSAAGVLRREVPVLRTEWLLYTMHLKRIALPLLATAAILYIPIIVATRAVQHARNVASVDANQVLNIFAVMLLIFFSLPVGTAAFARQFKEQNVLFFHTLPISRTRQWVVLICASLTALIATAIFLAIVHPASLGIFQTGTQFLAFGGILLLFFAAGACFSLAFLRPIEVYVGGFGLTILMLVGALWAALAPEIIYSSTGRPESAFAVEAIGRPEVPAHILIIAGALYLVLFLGASLRFYQTGELTLTRNRIRNPLIVVAIGIAIDFLIVPALQYAEVSRRPFRVFDTEVSADGRYVAYTVMREGAPWNARIRVFDTATQKDVATFERPGLMWAPFTGNVLTVISREMPFYRRLPFLAVSDRLDTYSADGRLLGSEKLHDERVGSFHRLGDAKLFALQGGDSGRVIAWDGSGKIREIVRADGIQKLTLGSSLAYARGEVGKSHVWRLGEKVTELPIVGAATADFPTVVHDVAYTNSDLAVRAIESRMPIPRKPNDIAVYEISSGITGPIDHLFAEVIDPTTRDASLFCESAGRWNLVAAGFKFSDAQPLPRSPAALSGAVDDISVVPAMSLVVYVTHRGNSATLHLLDANRNATLDVITLDDTRRDVRFFVSRNQPSRALIYVQRAPSSNPTNRVRVAEFLYRDGNLTLVPRHDGYLAALLPDGTQVRQFGMKITIYPPSGAPRKGGL